MLYHSNFDSMIDRLCLSSHRVHYTIMLWTVTCMNRLVSEASKSRGQSPRLVKSHLTKVWGNCPLIAVWLQMSEVTTTQSWHATGRGEPVSAEVRAITHCLVPARDSSCPSGVSAVWISTNEHNNCLDTVCRVYRAVRTARPCGSGLVSSVRRWFENSYNYNWKNVVKYWLYCTKQGCISL